MTTYLIAQVAAGAQALQIFDSWAGALGRQDYREFVLPHTRRIFDGLANTGVPLIHFGVGATAILPDLVEAGGHVIGVDWRQNLDDAWKVVGGTRGIQGNLDPVRLFGPRDRLLAAADDILARAARRPGHIFNLGHGVLPKTPVESLQALADHVHERTRV
jgi:uroporphyrinogen decarboxylase